MKSYILRKVVDYKGNTVLKLSYSDRQEKIANEFPNPRQAYDYGRENYGLSNFIIVTQERVIDPKDYEVIQ